MAHFLNQVRRQSGFPEDDSSDDDFSATTDEAGERRMSGIATSKSQKKTIPRSIASRADSPRTPISKKSVVNVSSSATVSTEVSVNQLTEEDLEICQRLDEEYERALEEREIGYNARYTSVRQSAVLSVFFMAAFLTLGTAFFMRQAAWTLPESMLFSIYTITTVGYGRSEMPTTPGFQLYAIFYILVGIAALTIMVAQVYQCIALEASRAQHARDKTAMQQRGLDVLHASRRRMRATSSGPDSPEHDPDEIVEIHHQNMPSLMDSFFRFLDRAKDFFRNNEVGRGMSVVFPFASLILVGALVVGPIEEWSFLEALYFSVVSLSTVGFGDYTPKQNGSIWFCILWLPFSVGFMSMYLGNVAAFYIRLSDRNIRRIERHMRRRLQRAKDKAEMERAEVLRRAYRGQEVEVEAAAATLREQADADGSDRSIEKGHNGIPLSHAQSLARRKNQDGFNVLPTTVPGEFEGSESHTIFGDIPVDGSNQRRQRIIDNSNMSKQGEKGEGPTMQSMRDIVRAVRSNLNASQKDGSDNPVIRSGPDVQFMSIRSTQTITTHNGVLRRVQTRKPSFALRVLVQERFAEIIATDIAGFHSAVEIEGSTLSITIDSLMETADKWLIPRRARKPFRTVAFEVLFFVGEHGLITRGADALLDLSPFEFHGLFSPLLAAMGDADAMEGWLASTDVLAAADLSRDYVPKPGLSPQKADDSTLHRYPNAKSANLPSIPPILPEKARMNTGMN